MNARERAVQIIDAQVKAGADGRSTEAALIGARLKEKSGKKKSPVQKKAGR